ncbi:MAG: hypothetical protein ACR2I2_09300 [Bryobacteraceae bacterium]
MLKKIALPLALFAAVAFIQPPKAAALDRDDFRGGADFTYGEHPNFRNAPEAREYREHMDRLRNEWRERERLERQRDQFRRDGNGGYIFDRYQR